MKNVAVSGAVLCLAAFSNPAYAQDETARKMATEIAARVPLERAVKGAPYSAETIVEGNQVLADGNRITQKTTGRVYRDSEGRTRREDDRKDGSVGISITDPVGGFSYSLDPVNKIAWRTPMGATGAIMGKLELAETDKRRVELERITAADGTTRVERKETKVAPTQADQEKAAVVAARGGGGRGGGGATGEAGAMIARSRGPETPLERKTIDGIAVEGHSMRRVIPAGQIGNEQPLTVTNEEWRSPDLNVLVMTRHTDPRSGESTYRLTNIVRAEPDASLFMVPPDYTVKDTGIRRMLEASSKR
jgi:hypothetical protein